MHSRGITSPIAIDSDQATGPRAAATSARFREAVEGGDIDAFIQTLSPDVVLRSPITMLTEIKGHEEMRELMACVFETIEDISYSDDVGDDQTRALFYRAHVGSQPVEEATLLRFDADARVREMTLWFRPLPGLAVVTAGLGPRLIRSRGGRVRGAVARALTKPLATMTRAGDKIAVRLLGD